MTGRWGNGEPLVGFRRDLRPEVVSGEATYLFSEHGVTALQGPQIEALAPLLDGTRDIPALLREAPESVSPQQIGDLMEQLAQAGLVALRPPTASPCDEQAIAYWEAAAWTAAGPPPGPPPAGSTWPPSAGWIRATP